MIPYRYNIVYKSCADRPKSFYKMSRNLHIITEVSEIYFLYIIIL